MPVNTRRPLLDIAWARWLVRMGLVAAVLYAGVALAFYSWYADFPGPNQQSARVVASIWSLVALAGIGALVASFLRRRPPKSAPPAG